MHPLVARAAALVGIAEGDPRLPIATSRRPWCAAFASSLLVALGVLSAPRWNTRKLFVVLAKLGLGIRHDGELRPGDLVGWPRSGPDSGHVEIVERVDGDWLETIGGNVANGVRRRRRARSRVKWAARPMPG